MGSDFGIRVEEVFDDGIASGVVESDQIRSDRVSTSIRRLMAGETGCLLVDGFASLSVAFKFESWLVAVDDDFARNRLVDGQSLRC